MGPRDSCSLPVTNSGQQYQLCQPVTPPEVKTETQQPPQQAITQLPAAGPDGIWWWILGAVVIIGLVVVWPWFKGRDR